MQKTLKIDEAKAKQLYPSAPADLKQMLEAEFGKETFVPVNMMDKVKTFEDACKVLGVNPGDVYLPGDNDDDIAYKKLKVIAKALNDGWKPDWANDDEVKYFPWFELSSGSGLSYYDYVIRRSASLVGSRLCFKSSELAKYAGKQFIDIYTEFFIIKPQQ